MGRFDDIVRSEHARVGRALLRYGVPHNDLLDATQDVFMVVHRRLPEFEGRASLSTWIHRIAMHVASSYRRSHRRRREVLDGDGASETPAGAHVVPEDRMLLGEVARAVDAIDADKRDVLILYELEELSMREVARQLRIPLKTGFSRLYAARRALFGLLRARGISCWAIAWPGRLDERWLSPLSAAPVPATVAVTWLAPALMSAALLVPVAPEPLCMPTHVAVSQVPTAWVPMASAQPTERASPTWPLPELAARRPLRNPSRPAPEATPPVDAPAPEAQSVREVYYYDTASSLRPRVLPPLAIPAVYAGRPLPRIVVRGDVDFARP